MTHQCKSCGGFCGKYGCERSDTIVPCKHFRSGLTNKTAADCPYCRIEELESQIQAAQPAHARAIDTSPEGVEKHAGNVKVPEGWKLVPVEPIEAMWSMLARDIVFWLYSTRSPHYGSELHTFLRNCGTPIPNWLAKEIPDVDHTPPKGTVAVCIYKAMLSAAPSTKEDV